MDAPPESLRVHALEDRYRGELRPAGDPKAPTRVYTSALGSVALLFVASMSTPAIGAVGFVLGFLGLIYAFTQASGLFAFPVPWELTATRLSVGDDSWDLGEIDAIDVGSDPLSLALSTRGGARYEWVLHEPRHGAADAEWLRAAILDARDDPDRG